MKAHEYVMLENERARQWGRGVDRDQDLWELAMLIDLLDVSVSPIRSILEIGSRAGNWLHCVGKYFQIEHGYVVDMDLMQIDNHRQYSDIIDRAHAFEGKSNDPAIISEVYSEARNVDILHIDGNHHYVWAKADYENYRGLVRDGGAIIFHDILMTKGDGGVKRFWQEISANHKSVSITTSPKPNGSRGKTSGGIGIIWRGI